MTEPKTGKLPRRTATRKSPLANFFYRLVKEQPLGLIGGLIVLVLLLVGIFADQLAQYGENEFNLRARLRLPHAGHWLGTDNLGRNLYTGIVYRARISLVIGLSATAVFLLVALVIAGLSGYIGGKTDLVVQRFVDAWMAFPGLLILLTAMSMLGNGQLQIIIFVGITFGIEGSRIVRSSVIGLKENTYLEAAQVIGTPLSRILLRHILPNILPPLIAIYTLTLGVVILTEAALSFLGFGLPTDQASWGGMLSNEGRQSMELAPHLPLWPRLSLVVVVFGVNLFGDALRDLLDTRLRGGAGRYGGGSKVIRKRSLLTRLIFPYKK